MLQSVVALLLLAGEIPVVKSADFPAEMQKTAVTATVRIHNGVKNAEGSGVLVGKKGPEVYILTAWHVVDGADAVDVAVFAADTYPKPKVLYRLAQVVAVKKGLVDLALVRLIATDFIPEGVKLFPGEQVPTKQGFPGLSVGCAGGDEPTCLAIKVAGKRTVRSKEGTETARAWEVEPKHAPGRSGGPLLDKRGFLLGICSGTNGDRTYFAHLDEVRSFLREQGFRWLADGKKER